MGKLEKTRPAWQLTKVRHKNEVILCGSWPPWSWWRGLVLVRIRTWQGSQEPAKGHCCGWPRGSHWVWERTPESCTRTSYHRAQLHDLVFQGAAMKVPEGSDIAPTLWIRSWWSPWKPPQRLPRLSRLPRPLESLIWTSDIRERAWWRIVGVTGNDISVADACYVRRLTRMTLSLSRSMIKA